MTQEVCDKKEKVEAGFAYNNKLNRSTKKAVKGSRFTLKNRNMLRF